ncbi:MAG: hypothetical protein ACYDAE_23180 [Steroidobacteraceae bacterium]
MKAVLKSLFGRVHGVADDDTMIAAKGFRIGDFPRQFLQSSPYHVAEFDDFTGATLLGTWAVLKGTDAACANFAITAALDGTIAGTTGATTATMAGSGIQIDSALNFEPSANGMAEFGCRVKLSTAASICLFVGFTNEASSLQMPMQGSGVGNAFTVNAANCAGFLYDTSMANPGWWGVSANASAASAGQQALTAAGASMLPVAATYDDVFVQIDSHGNVAFFLDGLPVGALVAAGIATGTPLTPVIAAFSRSAASTVVTGDYLYAASPRA